MRIALHDYQTDPGLPQKDGVNLAHENIAALLRRQSDSGLSVAFHDFNRLLADRAYAREVLTPADCVVSNVGPHSHYYFYLRDLLDLDFAIVRDVRTAIWSSYLLQEHLCRPYLRQRDVLLVASQYTRGICEKLFPHLRDHRTVLCYPFSVGFPADPPIRPSANNRAPRPFNLGYIGRLSEDKNFPDVIDLLIELNRTQARHYRLVACGDTHSASCHPDRVQQRLRAELGQGDYFEFVPARANGRIWELYSAMDALVFPSTSNLETLGRVLVEASYAGVPVVAGGHAATYELVPRGGLSPVSYECDTCFDTHNDHALGRVDIGGMAEALLDPALAELPRPLDRDTAADLLARLADWLLTLQHRDSVERDDRSKELLALSRYPERTQKYLDKCASTRCDFTDVGGLDIELCHVAEFYPEFRLSF
jgi:glycosyltransferase involved in cell wall biosynthesis